MTRKGRQERVRMFTISMSSATFIRPPPHLTLCLSGSFSITSFLSLSLPLAFSLFSLVPYFSHSPPLLSLSLSLSLAFSLFSLFPFFSHSPPLLSLSLSLSFSLSLSRALSLSLCLHLSLAFSITSPFSISLHLSPFSISLHLCLSFVLSLCRSLSPSVSLFSLFLYIYIGPFLPPFPLPFPLPTPLSIIFCYPGNSIVSPSDFLVLSQSLLYLKEVLFTVLERLIKRPCVLPRFDNKPTVV